MKYMFNVMTTGGASQPNFGVPAISCDASAADAIAWALAQAGSGSSLMNCNKGPAPQDFTQVSVALPAIQATHSQAISPGTVTASGGYPAYTFAAFGLPAGLTVNASTGWISGVPAAAGTYNYAVVITDADGNVGVATGTIIVA